jgi:ATP-dependent Lhr-like helicase
MSKLESWFADRGWQPFPFQKQTWSAYRKGESGLLHAPTGIGKTLAIWGGPLSQAQNNGGKLPEAITVLWITPLRALASDTLSALRAPVEAMGLNWSVEMRTGDTTSSQKAKQKRRLPTALVTTPESLSLMLTYPETRENMKTLRCVVIDEWHELMGNKRGVQTELCLARLRAWLPDLRIWGLSATIGNLNEAKAVILGDAADFGTIIHGKKPKKITIETLIPKSMDSFPWSGHLGINMLPQVIEQIEKANTTLFFTNTRSQTEIWFQALSDACPEWGDRLAMHHGSLERDIREDVERRLDEGSVKCVVCTSSLDLGVDFSPVEQVMQVGSPKGVARLIQRAGRSGHNPGAESKVIGVPTNAFELIEFAAAREAVKAKKIESRIPLKAALDVLAQHIVTVAIGGGFRADELLAEVRRSHAFRDLTKQEWRWALQFVTCGGPSLSAYEDYQKVILGDDGVYRCEDRRIAHLHRMNIGTISSDISVSVRFSNGKRLGAVEESFISKMNRGDQFIFAGRRLELVRFREMVADVCAPKKIKGKHVPQWHGGKSPLSSQLADAVAEKIRETGSRDKEMIAASKILDIQRAWSRIPATDELLIEMTETKEGHHVFIYPFAGRLVHEGLAALCAFRLADGQEKTIGIAFNDYGFELLCDEPFAMSDEDWREVFRFDTLLPDMLECMNITELAKRQFRGIARVAGLIIAGYPGQKKSMRSIQASAGLLFDVFSKYDPDNLLIVQAQREILEGQLDLARLEVTLQKIETCEIVQVTSARLTPLAFPLWADQLSSSNVSTESFTKRLSKMLSDLEQDAQRKDAREFQPELG